MALLDPSSEEPSPAASCITEWPPRCSQEPTRRGMEAVALPHCCSPAPKPQMVPRDIQALDVEVPPSHQGQEAPIDLTSMTLSHPPPPFKVIYAMTIIVSCAVSFTGETNLI